MKKFALTALVALSVATPAAAQNTTANTQILRDQIDGFLDNQKAMATKNNCTLVTKGQTSVEQANGYYAFTLPDITYTDAEGVRSDIGMVAVNATPDVKDTWKVSLALPTPINSYTKAGTQLVRTDIGSQTSNSIWNTRLGHFTSVSSNLGNVRINHLKEQVTITLGGVKITSLMNEQDPDAWTGKADIELANISVFDAETNFTGVIPKITLTTNLADRASKTPMTKEQIAKRTQAGYPDFYNVFAQLFGAPERVQAVVTGLDSVSQKLQQAMLTARPEQRQEYLTAIIGVSAISGIGKPVQGDASSKSYDIVFGQNGQITINGTDFSSLMKIKDQRR